MVEVCVLVNAFCPPNIPPAVSNFYGGKWGMGGGGYGGGYGVRRVGYRGKGGWCMGVREGEV